MQLEKSIDNKLITTYPKETEKEPVFNLFHSLIKSPIKYTYYELYNQEGNLVGITDKRSIAIFAAGRNNLDYREVQFEEEFKAAEE